MFTFYHLISRLIVNDFDNLHVWWLLSLHSIFIEIGACVADPFFSISNLMGGLLKDIAGIYSILLCPFGNDRALFPFWIEIRMSDPKDRLLSTSILI